MLYLVALPFPVTCIRFCFTAADIARLRVAELTFKANEYSSTWAEKNAF